MAALITMATIVGICVLADYVLMPIALDANVLRLC